MQCLSPRVDGRANRERAAANDCPCWIQYVADAAAALLRHSYELSSATECRFVEYRGRSDGRAMREEDVSSEDVVVFA